MTDLSRRSLLGAAAVTAAASAVQAQTVAPAIVGDKPDRPPRDPRDRLPPGLRKTRNGRGKGGGRGGESGGGRGKSQGGKPQGPGAQRPAAAAPSQGFKGPKRQIASTRPWTPLD